MQWQNIVLVGVWSVGFGVWQHNAAAAAFVFLTPAVILVCAEWIKKGE